MSADIQFYWLFLDSAAHVRTNPFIPRGPIMLCNGKLWLVGLPDLAQPRQGVNNNETRGSHS